MIMQLKWPLFGLIFTLGIFNSVLIAEDLNSDCLFCDEKILDYQRYYEDELVEVLYTHKPIFPGHSLIIPKRHVERFELLTDAEILRIGQVIKKVNRAVETVFGTSAYLLLQKNGKEVGQTVPHLHVHYIPRMEGDTSIVKFLWKMYVRPFLSPIESEEMHEITEKMKSAMGDS